MKDKSVIKFEKIRSPIKKKILLLLFGGLSLGLAHSPGRQIRVLKQMSKEWRKINRNELIRNLRELYNYGYISWREKSNGDCEVTITKKGLSKTTLLNLDLLSVKKPSQWDGKWRIVFFDIPEKERRARNALREKLRDLGFYEMQKSVFVLPYECQDEVNFVVSIFNIKPYVQYAEMTNPTNELELRRFFNFI